MTGTVSVDAVLAAFAEPAGEGPIMARRAAIDRLFAGDTRRGHSRRARSRGGRQRRCRLGGQTAATIRTKSPLSLKLALAQVRRGKRWDFETCMRTEFRIVSRVIHGHDFYEGVRAVIVDKDNKPRWRPATLAEVSEAEVERHFAPLGARRTGAAMSEPFASDDLQSLEPVHEHDGERATSAAGRGGWSCSCG